MFRDIQVTCRKGDNTVNRAPNEPRGPPAVLRLRPSMERQPEIHLRRARLRFAGVFVLVGGALLTLYSFPYAEHGLRESWFARYLALYAQLAGLVLRLFDSGVRVVGNDLVGRVSLTVAKNCDAMDVSLLFTAAVVAFPARWSRRLAGIAIGVLGLTIVNVLRIASLYYVDLRWPSAFETIHAEVWPLAIVAIAAGAFVGWSRWAQRQTLERA